MANPIDTDRNGKHDATAPVAAQARIAELVAENERLRLELEKLREAYGRDLALLNSHTREMLPKTEEELLRLAKEGPTFRELLDEAFRG